MQAGGYQGLLHDLLHHNSSAGPDPGKVIHTAALFDQVKRNLGPELRYVYELLDRGQLPDADKSDRQRATIRQMLQDLRQSVPNATYATEETLGRALRKALDGCFTKRLAGIYVEDPHAEKGIISLRSTQYIFVALPECRARFERFIGMRIDWSTDAPDWLPGDPHC